MMHDTVGMKYRFSYFYSHAGPLTPPGQTRRMRVETPVKIFARTLPGSPPAAGALVLGTLYELQRR